jgi:O-antigen/teichoic acid export membrane protein
VSGPNGKGRGNNRKGGKRKGGGKGKGKGKGKAKLIDSSAAALGSKLVRNSGLQGVSLVVSNLLHAVAFIYVASKLGPSDLGTYSLLFFLAGSITQVFHLFSKPGTLRRVFGQADDDDAGAEGDFDTGDEAQSESPQRSLGVGIIWVALLGLLGAGLAILLQDWIAGWLLGDSKQGELVAIAGVLGGLGAIFKLTEIIIWFEGRGWTYVIVDALRPTLNLVFMAYLIAQGEGVTGAITGAAIGTGIAVLVSIVVLVRSFELAFEFREVGLIVQRGVGRMPIAMSMFTIQNADGFLLSRFVDHKQLGYYQVAQKLGFIVSFLPQGFRIALRPLRKTAMFQAVRDQYGSAVAKGQLLIYFILIAIFAILAMVLGGELLINVAGGQYQAAAPLIPLTAAMMTMPALFRTVNGQSFFPHKRAWFISCVIFAALSFVGWMYLLVPRFGIVGTPVASILAFGLPSAFLFIKNQRGKGKIEFRYRAILGAIGIATAVSVFFAFVHPSDKWLQLIEVAALLSLWLVLMPLTGIVPRMHRRALTEVAKGAVRRGPQGFNRQRGLRSLTPKNREKLRRALVHKFPAEALSLSGPGASAAAGNGAGGSGDGTGNGAEGGSGGRGRTALLTRRPKALEEAVTERQAAQLVRLLRRVGRKGGMRIEGPTERDARIAKFLFADAPTAARNATMRGLVSAGADPKDLHGLEELGRYLAKSPQHAWKGSRRRRRVPVKIPVRLRRA